MLRWSNWMVSWDSPWCRALPLHQECNFFWRRNQRKNLLTTDKIEDFWRTKNDLLKLSIQDSTDRPFSARAISVYVSRLRQPPTLQSQTPLFFFFTISLFSMGQAQAKSARTIATTASRASISTSNMSKAPAVTVTYVCSNCHQFDGTISSASFMPSWSTLCTIGSSWYDLGRKAVYKSLILLSFFVYQCRNWDGGYQEFSSARDAVLEGWPGIKVIENRIDSYPVRVTVKANVNGKDWEIWKGRQQDLFRKYGAKRTRSMAAITMATEELKEELNDS